MSHVFLPQKEKLFKLFKKNNLLAVYLFGSRADGTASENSDFDFGLLIEHTDGLDKASLLQLELEEEASMILEQKVDSILLNTATIEQRFFIISRGVLIYCINDDKRTDFEDTFIRDYLDFKPFSDQFRHEVREAMIEGGFFAKP